MLRKNAALLALSGVLVLGGCARENNTSTPVPAAQAPITAEPGQTPVPSTETRTLVPTPQGNQPANGLGTAPGTHRIDPVGPGSAPVAAAPAASAPARSSERPVRRRETLATQTIDDDRPRVVEKRSKKKSAAIIGGSAAAGAAIGALAGGGKGAAIGAIVGGVGGTVYDRKTATKKERAEQ